MTTIGFYFPLNPEETNSLRARLNLVAKRHGYTTSRGRGTGQGNLVGLLIAIDTGEVATVLLSDEQRKTAIRELNIISAQIGYGDNWAENISEQLINAALRGDQ